MIEHADVRPGYYIAQKKAENGELEGDEMLVVVWSIFPFLQIFILPTTEAELHRRPNFMNVEVADIAFLARVPDAKALRSLAETGSESPTRSKK